MKLRNNRFWLALGFGLATYMVAPPAGHAGPATDQIRIMVDKAIVVLKDPRYKDKTKTKERRDQLKQILFTRFDFAEMAKRSLGAHWRKRSTQEQEEFVKLFTDLLERTYADIIVDGGSAEVASKIVTRKGDEYSINYKAQATGGEWKVYDVVAENISLVNNYRSQFDRVINKSSYEDLVQRLKSKADFDGAPKK
jgi:phospholipid transport system substrate-binding protein